MKRVAGYAVIVGLMIWVPILAYYHRDMNGYGFLATYGIPIATAMLIAYALWTDD
jgi:hypothetical protein